MALEAVVYPQPQGHYGYGHRDSPSCFFGDGEPYTGEWDPLLLASLVQNAEEWEELGTKQGASPESEVSAPGAAAPPPVMMQSAVMARRKRRRGKVAKNQEEIESQRTTHIAVERNRRRQMNEYLAVLRSLMPPSYVQRGDQASIVGGAINYVRELEQLLQSLEVQKSLKGHNANRLFPFAGFFSSPQYASSSACHSSGGGDNAQNLEAGAAMPAVAADIEVTMVEGHASLKVQVRRRPRQLLRLAAGLHRLGFTTLHLNVSTTGAMVLYSFILKVEDECKLSSVEEIAAAVHDLLGRIQEEQAS